MWREFFYLRKSDRKVILAFLGVAVIAFIGLFLTDNRQEKSMATPADSLKAETRQTSGGQDRPYEAEGRRVELFPFDPNTADSTQLLRLGLRPWQVRNIYKYRAKGGIYRKPLDFAKLYGLTVGQYRALEPYIRISDDYLPASTLVGRETVETKTPDSVVRRSYPVKISETERVVLNTADTTQLKTIPGIGSYFARRIVGYGDRLGGYVDVSQLDEIEDFPQDAKKYLVVQDPRPRKLNVNKLSLNELKHHPYINFYQAKAITEYRRLRGPIHSLDDLRLSPDFTPETIRRLTPYVEY